MKYLLHLTLLAFTAVAASATEFHVATNGANFNPGTRPSPFRTIQRAADMAQPGDTITVHAGVYREYVNPPRGGESDAKRIVYQAAAGEKVVITGSEEVKNWEKVQDGVWKATLPNTFFGSFNPFAELIAGDWFHDNNRSHHAGAVYLNGHWLTEAVSLEEVLKPMTETPLWFASVDATRTVIWAQFKDIDPNAQQVEVNARQSVFYPDKPGRNFITVRGFTLRNAATPWAPPTVEQIGLIGVHWSKGWIIENNDIAYSTCSGITLGKYGEDKDKNSGSASGYVTTIERGLKNGWNKETVGHHVVRNNHIAHCEQAGIVGSLGAVFSTVSGNSIHDIHVRQLFSGAEMAGIKFHGPIDATISGNHIYRTCRGIWLDWMTQGTRISNNLCHDNATHDLFVEVNHGPFVVDNNIFLSPKSIEDDSQGGAYAHNLIAGGIDLNPTFFDGRKTPFHKAHSTEVVALHDNPSGDSRYYNNLFMRSGSLEKYDQAHLPMWMDGNVFFQGTKSSKHESAPIHRSASDPGLTLVEKNDGFYLTMTLATALGSERPTKLVTSARLGKASISGCTFENPDGSPITIGTDYFGKQRNAANPTPGPFEAPGTGTVTMKVWPLTVGEKALVTGSGPAGKTYSLTLAESETALSCGKPATASSTWGAGFEPDKAVDGNDESRWGAAPDTRSGWLEVDLGKDTAVGCAVIKELGLHRTEAFAVECKEDHNWKELIKGSTIAGEKVLKFAPVTARYFRLNILKANEVPTIEEFQLYAPGTKISATAEKPRDPKLKWFDESKYGLFINWGLYSIPAGEWKGKKYDNCGEWIMYDAKIPAKEYRELAKQFKPQKFNAEEWAQLAVDAGMKYLVFDCKHHDGFALYRSEVSKYNCYDATPWKRDPFKELQEACKKRNIKLCFYYSQAYDWNEPNGGNNNWDFKPDTEKDFDQYLRDKSMPQVTELLKNYGSIGLIWFDMPVMMTPERSKKLADLVRSIQPEVLINSRLGEGKYHDYRSMGDNEIPNLTMDGAWETAATVNDTWGYKTDDHNWKQPDNITFKLVDIASKGGNYLLNVGPDADGFIPQPSQDILRRVGKWLKVNGEAVYGAGRTPFGDELGKYDPEKKDNRGRPVFNETTDWRCTVKPMDWTWGKAGKLYLHLFKWPGARFELAGFNGKVEKAYMLADPDRTVLKHSVTEGKLTIELPEKATDEIDSVLCIELQK